MVDITCTGVSHLRDKKEKEDQTVHAFTPFGVLVDETGALKSFDDDSFYEEVLLPAEKEQLKRNKDAFLKDPDAAGTVQELAAGLRYVFWDKPCIESSGRAGLVYQRIASNTWALNKDAIPGFLDLLEKLRQKYSTVLGDDKLLQHLEAAQHRARELEATDEVVEAATSGVVKHNLQSGYGGYDVDKDDYR